MATETVTQIGPPRLTALDAMTLMLARKRDLDKATRRFKEAWANLHAAERWEKQEGLM